MILMNSYLIVWYIGLLIYLSYYAYDSYHTPALEKV